MTSQSEWVLLCIQDTLSMCFQGFTPMVFAKIGIKLGLPSYCSLHAIEASRRSGLTCT